MTRESFTDHPLAGRAELERAAVALHRRARHFDPAARGADAEAAAALARLLLPAEGPLFAKRRWAVMADGALTYVPWALLPSPQSGRPLVAEHELVLLPSVTALAEARRREEERPAPHGVFAAVADPLLTAAGSQLPGTGVEVAALRALAPPGESLILRGAAASRSRVVSGELEPFRLLHFATHGVFNAETPALSGLALARFTAAGQPTEGFLHLRDIFSLELNPDLVVLSACDSALGEEVRGEGLVGLVWGFLYAGAARVVASLWPVEDRATAALMEHFYRGLWQEGLAPAAALAAAQHALAAERRTRDPSFWAGWVLVGDWRPGRAATSGALPPLF